MGNATATPRCPWLQLPGQCIARITEGSSANGTESSSANDTRGVEHAAGMSSKSSDGSRLLFWSSFFRHHACCAWCTLWYVAADAAETTRKKIWERRQKIKPGSPRRVAQARLPRRRCLTSIPSQKTGKLHHLHT